MGLNSGASTCSANLRASKVRALSHASHRTGVSILVYLTQPRCCAILFKLDTTGDKSRKGSVDAPIAGLVHDLNTRSDMYTTSSCSGRISIFGEAGEAERMTGKKGGEWLLASHDTVDLQQVLSVLREGVERSGVCCCCCVTYTLFYVNASLASLFKM